MIKKFRYKMIDAHFHVFHGDLTAFKKEISTSKFKDEYILYSRLNMDDYDYVKHSEYFEKIFCIPLFIKETNITDANKKLLSAMDIIPNGLAVPLIDESDHSFARFRNVNMIGGKEHFLLHNEFECVRRFPAYEWLQNENKFLLLHCSSDLRVDYVQFLRKQFPMLKIVVAHLGSYRGEINRTKDLIDAFFEDANIYFDLSTEFNLEVLDYALKKLNYDRILFGSDTPFENQDVGSLIEFVCSVVKKDEYINKILYDNAMELICHENV